MEEWEFGKEQPEGIEKTMLQLSLIYVAADGTKEGRDEAQQMALSTCIWVAYGV